LCVCVCVCVQDAERLCDKIIERNAALLGPDHVCRSQVSGVCVL
jgi:hypothetical protein